MTGSPQVDSAPTSYHSRGQKHEAVLIVAHGDGWIEAYAERHVDVRIEIMPHMQTPEGEIGAEHYIEVTLSKRYHDLYWPDLRRAAGLVRVIRPSDIARRDWELDMLQSIEQAGEMLRGDDTEGRKVWML